MTPEEQFRTLRIVWVAMLLGLLGYAVVAYALMSIGLFEMNAFGVDVMNIVGAFVILQLLVAIFLRRRMVATIPDAAPLKDRLARYGRANVVGLALMEGGGLLVISFGMISGAPQWVLAGGGAAAAVMLMARPSRDEIGI